MNGLLGWALSELVSRSAESLTDGYWRFHNQPHGGAPSFDFCEASADEALFEQQCAFLQTSEESPFVMSLVAQRFVDGGYEVQLGRLAKRITLEGTTSHLLETGTELVERLKTTFDLDVPEVAELWPKIVARHDALFNRR